MKILSLILTLCLLCVSAFAPKQRVMVKDSPAAWFKNEWSKFMDSFNYFIDGRFFLYNVKPLLIPIDDNRNRNSENLLDTSYNLNQKKQSDFQVKVQCPLCKAQSWVLRYTVGLPPVGAMIDFSLKFVCHPIISFLTPYAWNVCDGIIEDQFAEIIWPTIVEDLFEETTWCTFLLEICDDGTWIKEDVKEYV